MAYEIEVDDARRDTAVTRFRSTWDARLNDYETSLSLLSSPAENDFAGMVEIIDESYVDEFVDDLTTLLKELGKIDGVKRLTLHELIDAAAASKSTFSFSGDNNLPRRTLTVLTDYTGFKRSSWNDYGKRCVKFAFERLSSIVDERYALVVGTSSELDGFLDEDRRLTYTFGQHRMRLSAVDVGPLYDHYLACLDPRLAAQATSSFRQRFADFVRTNAGDLPFHGTELADYLAKHANAAEALVLPKSRHESGHAQHQIDDLVGLEQVKKTVEELRCLALACRREARRGGTAPTMHFHMLFAGNPGVGKTMVARIVGRMLFEIGTVPTDAFTEVTAKDLISASVGESATQTAEVIEKARGGVLFVDEAYSLVVNPDNKTGSSHGREALAELVKAMDAYDDLVVILAGYRDEMHELVAVNPGLQSRVAYTLEFEDYTPAELTEMFVRKARDAQLAVSDDALHRLDELFSFHARMENFGNGRFVDQVFQRAYTRRALRIQRERGSAEGLIVADDVPTSAELMGESLPTTVSTTEALEGIIGLDDIKRQIADLEHVVSFRSEARRRGMHLPEQALHMVFSGNPGTGKTTIARIVGRLLFSIGALPSPKFREVTARDLVSSYVGETAQRTHAVIAEATGGVLFIDEAYSLVTDADSTGSSHGKEALAELVKAMEDRRDRLVVILAGYSDEMRQLLDTNPGMSSRIGYSFEFPDYQTDELVEMFELHLRQAGFGVESGALDAARTVFEYFQGVNDFGNGRFVARLIQETIITHSKRCSEASFATIEAADVPSVEHMAQISATNVIAPRGRIDRETRRRMSYHEAGRAICGLALCDECDVLEITVWEEPHGSALGHVLRTGRRPWPPTAPELFATIAHTMSGMASEQMAFGSFTTANEEDLQVATQHAIRYVAVSGMSDLGFVQFTRNASEVSILSLPLRVQEKVREVLAEAYARALQAVEANQEGIERLADQLMRTGSASREQVLAIWNDYGVSSH